MRTITRVVLTILSVLVVGSFAGLSAPANAKDVPRYWAYFEVKGGEFSSYQVGLGASNPKDGGIEGYRWAAPADYTKPNLPRADLSAVTFDAVCADVEPTDGTKRVAVIIDYGVEADADGAAIPEPETACAQVPTKATGLQVLQSVAEVRSENADFGPMLCGINGFPASGCGDAMAPKGTPADGEPVITEVAPADVDASAAPEAAGDETDEQSADAGSSTGLYALLGIVALALIAGGVIMSRRSKNTNA